MHELYGTKTSRRRQTVSRRIFHSFLCVEVPAQVKQAFDEESDLLFLSDRTSGPSEKKKRKQKTRRRRGGARESRMSVFLSSRSVRLLKEKEDTRALSPQTSECPLLSATGTRKRAFGEEEYPNQRSRYVHVYTSIHVYMRVFV